MTNLQLTHFAKMLRRVAARHVQNPIETRMLLRRATGWLSHHDLAPQDVTEAIVTALMLQPVPDDWSPSAGHKLHWLRVLNRADRLKPSLLEPTPPREWSTTSTGRMIHRHPAATRPRRSV